MGEQADSRQWGNVPLQQATQGGQLRIGKCLSGGIDSNGATGCAALGSGATRSYADGQKKIVWVDAKSRNGLVPVEK